MKRLLSLAVALAAWICARAVSFTSAPGSVSSGQSYTVSAEEWGYGYSTEVYIYKNGSFFAAGSGWGYASAGDSTTDYGTQTVTYEAYSGWYDEWWNYYGDYTSTQVSVVQPNNAPTISWHVNPGSVPVGQNYYIQVRGADQDGNLFGVSVWKDGVPYALNGGQNTSEMYSDVNWLNEGSPQQITFTARAYDNSGAESEIISHTVNIYVPNVAPTITWVNYPPQSAYINQSFAVQARANDGNANLNWIYVWRDDQPFAFNAASGGEAYSDNNLAVPTAPFPTTFKAMAGDSSGADSGFIYGTTQVVNRAPTMTPTTITGPTVGWNSTYQHYTMWSGDPGISGSGTLTMSSTLQDADANLVNHTLRYRQVTLNPNTWIQLGNNVPAGAATSTKAATLTTVETPGQWDFNAFGHDGWISHPGESKTVWVYGSTNAAAFVSQAINGTALPVVNPTFSLNTGNNTATATILMRNTGAKPWQNPDSQFGTPHRLGAIGPTPSVWGATLRDMSTASVDPESFPGTNDTATFSFTFNIPQMPGNYVFQWKMLEQGVAGDPYFETATPAVAVAVIDTTPPSTSTLQLVNRTHNSVSLSWTAATDNSGVIAGYNLYRGGSLIQALGNVLSFVDAGLTPNTAYTYTVKARDAAANLSAFSNPINVTTRLTPGQDQDGDGLPNEWEEDNGLNPFVNDALLDPDGDGLTNVAEYNLNRDPQSYNQGTSTVGGAVPAGWPNADANPSLAVGFTAGSINVDKSGALGYSIPIWTTPGTAGMAPKVSLNYSSQSGNGIAGFGWSLGGVSVITRGPQTKAIDGQNRGVTLTSSDRFYLDGQRLIYVGGGSGYGAAGSEYRTELDSITKVVANGSSGSGPASFTAWTKAGLIIQFGQTADSTFDANGSPGGEKLAWHVNRISDTKGNFMDFVYYKDAPNGTHRLDRINYTGNGAVAPYASLRFEYESTDRPDWSLGYVAGSPVSNYRRLKYIRSYYGETVARTYTLDYSQIALTNRSLLTSLTEAGSDGKAFPALTFQYQENDLGWAADSGFTPPAFLGDNQPNSGQGWPTGTGTGFVDLNGDGRVDFVQAVDSTASAYLNTGAGWTTNTNYNLPYPLAVSNTTVVDTGARFVDLNGDGLVDYVYRKVGANGALQQNQAWINSGSGWTNNSAWCVPVPIARDGNNNNDPLRGGRFVDINGDGRPDFVAFMTNGTGTANLAVYLNNGSGFNASPDVGYSSMAYNLSKYKPAFIDLNGDGLPDITCYYNVSGDVLQKTWLNTGSGWVETPAYALPQPIADNVNATLGAEFVDVNGDGLPDLIWYRELSGSSQKGVAINTGAGWLVPAVGSDLANRFTPASPLSRDGNKASGAAVMDLNADGIADITLSRDFGQGQVQATNYGSLHDFPGASSPSHNLPGLNLLQVGVVNTGADFIDFNGDGAVDVVWNRRYSNGTSFSGAWHNKSTPLAGRLIKVTNGMGVAANIAYKPLTDSSVYTKGVGTGPSGSVDVVGPMYVVSSLSNDDGVGGSHVVNYIYGGLRMDILRGNLGFATMSVTDSRTGIVTKTDFRQDYPFIGLPASSTTKTSGGTTLSATSATYVDQTPAATTRLPYASQSIESTYELNGSLVTTTTTTTSIDNSANVTSITVASADGFSKTTTNQYNAENPSAWLLGRLTNASVSSSAPNTPTITRTSSFTYDPTSGLLETEAVEPTDAALALTTTYGYDGFGNKTSVTVSGATITVTDANGTMATGAVTSRITSTQYDSNGRFPVWTKKVLSEQENLTHKENYTGYDQVRGVLTAMTGVNNLPTSWTYDGFGRKISETRADGTHTYTTYRWVNSMPAGFAGYSGSTSPTVKYSVETTADGAPPSLSFYDGFGRTFLNLAVNGDGVIAYQATVFDNLGRAYAKSNPYLNNGSTVYWSVTTQYDLLNRPMSVQTPDDTYGPQTTSMNYSGLTTTVTDAKGRVSKTVKNSQGWVTESIRNDGNPAAADYSRVVYTYDALGNLTQTDAAGVSTSLAYDLRGRKTSMADPDMGSWLYRYNIFGELIWQRDAKLQIVKLTYDALGRLKTRDEAEGVTTWTYDSASGKGVGKIAAVSSPGGYSEAYAYDVYGRPASLSRTIDGVAYAFDTSYDSLGRLLKTTYPTVNGGRFATRQVYNTFGYLKEIRTYDPTDDGLANNQLKGRLFWQADHFDQSGRIDGELLGNGLANDRVYSAATGRLMGASIDKGRVVAAPFAIQQMVYTYDQVGNVLTRADQAVGRGESFAYDGLDRLLNHSVVTGAGGGASVTYDQKGNILTKSDVGTYAYDPTKKHALSGVSGGALGTQTYSYDANGNMTGGGGRGISWTSFNQALSITKGSFTSTFSFGAAHERVKQISHLETTVYVGGLFEKVTPVAPGAATEYKHYIVAPTGRVAIYTDRSTLVRDTRFFHTDGLGSITAVSDEKGSIVKRFAFDAWGKRIDPSSGTAMTGTNAAGFRRGYTDHEQLDDLGLVHMNGRVYDPVLGRFLSADPFVQDESDSQAFNRYSYVGNNPLGATDPTGFFSLKDALKIVAVVVVGVVTAGAALAATGFASSVWAGMGMVAHASFGSGITGFMAAVTAGAAGGFASGFAGSLLNGGSIGDAFKAGLIGGLVGGVAGGLTFGIGNISGDLGYFGTATAHGVVQGGANEAMGGQFRHGFYAGFASAAAGGKIDGIGQGRSWGVAARVAASAIVGGTASVLGGGKFANGAVSGAFVRLFNAEAHADTYEFGLGVEIPKADAVQPDGSLDAAEDPGHTFAYLKKNGAITDVLSFGPSESIGMTNVKDFVNGNLPGRADWPLSGQVASKEWSITQAQYDRGVKYFNAVKIAPGIYSPSRQCTSMALRAASVVGVSVPNGVGRTVAYGREITVANPWHLSQQLELSRTSTAPATSFQIGTSSKW